MLDQNDPAQSSADRRSADNNKMSCLLKNFSRLSLYDIVYARACSLYNMGHIISVRLGEFAQPYRKALISGNQPDLLHYNKNGINVAT